MQLNFVEVLIYTGNDRPDGGSKGLQAQIRIPDREASGGILELAAGSKGKAAVIDDWREEVLSQVRKGWEHLDKDWPEDGSWQERMEKYAGSYEQMLEESELIETSDDEERAGVLFISARIAELFQELGAEVRLDETKLMQIDDEKVVGSAVLELFDSEGQGGFKITVERV